MTLFLLLLVTGSAVFTVLAIIAAERYRAVKPSPLDDLAMPPMSVLKPLRGHDEGLEENLRSFFNQDYPEFEILFAVEDESDPAVPVVRGLIEKHPSICARLVIAGPSPLPNAKVHSLRAMVQDARHETIVMADSDVRVSPDYLRILAAEMSAPKMNAPNIALVTSPYRAVPGTSVWSRLEAIGLNTEFIAGVLTARMLGGMDFALGPSIVTRKKQLEEIGGLVELQAYLAEDFVMGNRMARRGWGVVLSSYAVEHHIGTQALVPNLAHRLRWNRSTRRSRPWGYVGQVFTYPLPLALALSLWAPAWWGVSAAVIAIRYVAAWRMCSALRADFGPAAIIALPIQDLFSVAMWSAGFIGSEIVWRGRRFTIDREGRFRSSAVERER